MNISDREKREWGLMIFIIPMGITLMMLAGQVAIRIIPTWAVNADMASNLDPNIAPNQHGYVQPISGEILATPLWYTTFLTPSFNSENKVVYPAFVVFEPSATPPLSPSPSPTPPLTASPRVTETPSATETPTMTPSETPTFPPETKTPKDEPTSTPSTPTPTDTSTPTDIPTPTDTPTDTPTPTPTAATPPSTIDPSLTPTSVAIATVAPGSLVNIPSGKYVVVDFSGHPVVVEDTPDGYYDLIFYEDNSGGSVLLDHISIGISQASDGSTYWEVFNWGSGGLDTNTNVGVLPTIPPSEPDNQKVDVDDLYPNPGTGILIDVDTASSTPPAGSYGYVVIISPADGGDPAQVNAIVVTEVPLP